MSFSPSAIVRTARSRFQPVRGAALYEQFLRFGQWYDRRVAGHLARNPLPAGRHAFSTFTTGCLEAVQLLRNRGVTTIVCQIDGARVEYDIARAEATKWPEWADTPPAMPDAYFDRLAAEWEAAGAVVVNSAWSADALVRQGVPRSKLHVIPLAYESDPGAVSLRSHVAAKSRALVVLWLGNVVLRKGIQYLIEATRLLDGRSIRFVVVGSLGISQKAVATAPANVEFTGPVTRDQTAAIYEIADLFVLPTLSDGFAITELEAMAHGLPVITTPNCGAVVDDGLDGLIVPPGDAIALAAGIATLADDPSRRAEMGRNAIHKSRTFSLTALAAGLDAIVGRLAVPKTSG